MAHSEGDGAEKALVPTESSKVDSLSSALGQSTEENGRENIPVLLTQREETGPQIILSPGTDLADSEDRREEINALADEVVKSSIDLAVSEHEQIIAHTAKSLTHQIVTDTAMDMEIRDRAMSLADKVVTGAALECDTLDEMGPDSVFGDTYLEPVPDPYTKAIAYLEKHNILQLFQGLTSNVVLHQPTDPLEAMMEQLQIYKNPEPSAESIDLSQLNREESAVM